MPRTRRLRVDLVRSLAPVVLLTFTQPEVSHVLEWRSVPTRAFPRDDFAVRREPFLKLPHAG